MAAPIVWQTKLGDGVSGVAAGMGAALDGLAGKFSKLGAVSTSTDNKLRLGHDKQLMDLKGKLAALRAGPDKPAMGPVMPGRVVGTPRHLRDDMERERASIEKLAAARRADAEKQVATLQKLAAAKLASKEANLREAQGYASKSGAAAAAFREATALEQVKAKALEAARAMDRLRAASRAAAASPMISPNKTGANSSGLFGQGKSAQSAVGRVAQAAGNMFGDRGANAVLGTARALDSLSAAAGKTRGGIASLSQVGKGALSVLGSIAAGAAMAAAALAGIGIGLGIAGAKYVAGLQSLKSSILFSLAANAGGAQAGAEAWAKIQMLAVATGNDLQQTAGAMNGLLAGGFKLGEAEDLMRVMADMKTLDPSANLEGIALAIKQIKMTGKLQGDELNQLGNAVSVDAVYTELAKKLGKSKEEIIKMKEAGKITADDAIAAIKSATLNKTGMKAGGLAEAAASKTMVGSIGKAKAAMDVFLSGLNIDFSPIFRFLEKIQTVLKGEAGAKFGKSIEDGFAGFLGILDSISEKDIAAGFDVASGLIKGAADAARDFSGAIKTIDGWMSAVTDKTSTWSMAFAAIGGIVSSIGSAIMQTFLGPLYAVYDIVTQIIGALSSANSSMSTLSSSATMAGGGEGSSALAEQIVARVSGNSTQMATGGAASAAPTTKNFNVSIVATGVDQPTLAKLIAEGVQAELSGGADAPN